MVKLGIERIDEYKELFANKKVGLITNPTGVTSDFTTTIEVLQKHTNLVALFSPEHGVRGDLQAGVTLGDYIDEETGCMVYSLYGKNKKPSKEMLDNIDILAFDIQGVGARFYTFVYTMAYAMMACAEYGKKMLVFDRPNPVNASTVEGNILDITYRSFIGYFPLPQRHGLTIGELALLFNKEYKINCDLEVIPMIDYKRNMDFEDTQLPWVFPSPNIPNPISAYAYLGTCIFEGTNISEGRGTTKPFEIIGSPFLKHEWLKNELNLLNLPGVRFRALYFTPMFSKHQGTLCKGIEIIITDKRIFEPVKMGYIILDLIKNNHPEFSFNKPYTEKGHPMIDLNTGGSYVRDNSKQITEQLAIIIRDSKEFQKLKRRYHIYE